MSLFAWNSDQATSNPFPKKFAIYSEVLILLDWAKVIDANIKNKMVALISFTNTLKIFQINILNIFNKIKILNFKLYIIFNR